MSEDYLRSGYYQPGFEYNWNVTDEQAQRFFYWSVKGEGQLRLKRKVDGTFFLMIGTTTLAQVPVERAEGLIREVHENNKREESSDA
jgi:hypothetical protein